MRCSAPFSVGSRNVSRAMPAPEPLTHLVRPPVGEPTGLLVLFHGRGADERDLFPLLDLLDPERRMLGVTPRGPLHLPPGGAHWYAVHEIGYPDPPTFSATFGRAAAWLDGVADDAGIAPGERRRRRVLAGSGDERTRSVSGRDGRAPPGWSR